ncbi:MAG TPA: glycosyltransferase family 2 protein [Polyangiaceae bacterium]
MLLSVVVVNWNSRADLEACLRSLRAQTHRELEIVVIDNGSHDGSADMVRAEFPEVKLLREAENLGFAEACNLGIDASCGPWVAMLNNDATAEPKWAEELCAAAAEVPARAGMLQSLMLFQERPDEVNSTGIELTRSGGGRDRDAHAPRRTLEERLERQEIFCPTAGAAAYRREMLDALRLPVGYFDRDHFCYYEDMDLGWRARLAGWSAFFVPTSVVHHRYHGSTERRGSSWLFVTSRTNRLRTLLKNASWGFVLTTTPHSAYDVARILWYGRASAARGIVRALRGGMAQRQRVGDLSAVRRGEIERRWVVED